LLGNDTFAAAVTLIGTCRVKLDKHGHLLFISVSQVDAAATRSFPFAKIDIGATERLIQFAGDRQQAVAHGLRLSRWSGLATTAEPMLFVLHVAYLWFPVGYLLVAWSALGSMLGWVYPPSVALHALTMGAIGVMVLAMTTRVSLGHTGRVPQAARLTAIGYLLLNLAVVIRIAGPLFGAQYMRSVEIAAVAWIATFVLFLWVYWPILTQPRAD